MTKLIIMAAATSADVFAACLSIDICSIKMPFRAMLSTALAGAAVLSVSVLFSSFLGAMISARTATALSKILLLAIGIHTIRESLKERDGSSDDFIDISRLMSDGSAADSDKSRSISVKEAFVLGFALSLDSVAMGIGAGLSGFSPIGIFAAALAGGVIAAAVGYFIGTRLEKLTAQSKCRIPTGALGGVMLIILAMII
ncbi:MAG: manganese efflux pump [Oscillospiraceae bacterium]|nr:manganese efflux pump [Oscillospiraceae bacterium]